MKKSFIPLFSFFILVLASCLPAQPTEKVTTGKSGEMLYKEDFSNNTSGWDRFINDGGIMDYDSGGFRILVRQPKVNFWSTPAGNYQDVRVEADVTKLNGPDANRAGLMCRYRNGDYYFFIISNDGFYTIGKFIGGNAILLGQEAMQPTEFIKAGETNHLRADCIGSTLTLYVNFNQVASVPDTDFPTGGVGVIAGTFEEPGVDVLFQNFVVLQP
ncbi:MAG: hypothetical protein IPP66_09355 [Anaerolineales bacterium]|nr:hypothetical protein [Anaerolineales bacterium]